MKPQKPLLKKIAIALGKVLLAIAFWGFLWFLLAKRIGIDLIFPSPRTVFRELWLLLTERSESLVRYGVQYSFWHITLVSLLRVVWGVLVSIILGCLLAYLTSVSRLLHTLLSPALSAIKATPVASFIILALVWISSGILPGFISMLMVIPVVWANIYEGISSVDSELLEVAKVYRFSGLKTLKLIYLPSLRPYFKAAIITSLGMAWKSGIAAEVLCQPKGSIGIGLYYSKLYLETADLFAWTAVVIILSFIVEKGVAALLKRM